MMSWRLLLASSITCFIGALFLTGGVVSAYVANQTETLIVFSVLSTAGFLLSLYFYRESKIAKAAYTILQNIGKLVILPEDPVLASLDSKLSDGNLTEEELKTLIDIVEKTDEQRV